MLVVAALMVSAAVLAGCALPSQDQTAASPTTLDPIHRAIPGLTPEHARGHPVDLHISADGTTAFVPMPGTISRPQDRIVVVDLTDGRIRDEIQVGLRPLAIVPDPMEPERLLVAHPYTNAITVIDSERLVVTAQLAAPHYLEDLAFSLDGRTLVATDRAMDRLVVYNVTRDGDGITLTETRSIPTGPNPEHVTFVPDAADPAASSLVAATDRHGASVTLADTATGQYKRIPLGGPPLALAARDGLVFIAGLGPGTGGNMSSDGTAETGTADIENSLIVLDLRAGARLLARDAPPVPTLRYISDTARPDGAHAALRLVAGATPRHLEFDNDTLWVTYHGSDQVQRLHYTAPETGGGVTTSLLVTPSGASGTRLSHLGNDTALAPGRLSDAVHGVYETPPGPRASARNGDLLVTVAEFSEQLQVLDLTDCPGPRAPTATCTHAVVDLVRDPVPYPSGAFEEGERLFVSALPSADQDRSCASCHMDGLSTAQTWQLPHRPGTPMLVPRLDQGPGNAPWLIDGSATRPGDYLAAAGGDLLRPDPDDPWNLAPSDAGPDTGRDAFAARTSGLVANVRDPTAWMNRTFAYALGELRILPTPPALDERAAERPEARDRLTGDTGCFGCHMPEESRLFTDPDAVSHIPRPANAEAMKARPLNGIWDRNGTAYLFDGRVDRIIEALLWEGHQCLDGTGQPDSWHSEIDEYHCGTIRATVDHVVAYTPSG